jgi:hypothetical protein
LNYQKPIKYQALIKLVQDGKVLAISPEQQSRLNEDISKSIEGEFDGIEKSIGVVEQIRSYKRVLIDKDGKVSEYLVKAIREQGDTLEKGDEYYALSGAITTKEGKPLPFLKNGKEISIALLAMIQKLSAENVVSSSKMSDCVVAVGFGPTDSPYEASERAYGNRYSWEVCRQFDGHENTIGLSDKDSQQTNACREYNTHFNNYCSNMRSIRLCNAYIANLKDETSYQLSSNLYTLLF